MKPKTKLTRGKLVTASPVVHTQAGERRRARKSNTLGKSPSKVGGEKFAAKKLAIQKLPENTPNEFVESEVKHVNVVRGKVMLSTKGMTVFSGFKQTPQEGQALARRSFTELPEFGEIQRINSPKRS